MDLFNTISCAVAAAYEAVANRNRQAAVNNRLKAVVRSELATINRAYIALGKHFYNDLRSQAAGDEAVLCNAIDQAKERILKAPCTIPLWLRPRRRKRIPRRRS